MQSEQNIFKLHSEYAPTGDQPQAIEALADGVTSDQVIDRIVETVHVP